MERLRPWLRRSGWAYIVVAIVLAALGWRIAAHTPAASQPQRVATTARTAERPASRSPDGTLIHVAGAVRRPGLYRVAADQRVAQAIKNAGGATPDANLDAINLAAPVSDGERIVVPRKPAPDGGGASSGAPPTADTTVSLSAATVEQLDALDGIGPTLAARIIDWREQNGGFTSVDQLLDVPGIGQARLDAIRVKLTP